MSIESKLNKWLKQPGTFVTSAEREFIARMREAAAAGVGYGWMQQVIEWEWQDLLMRKYGTDVGAFGPEHCERFHHGRERPQPDT